MTTEVFEHRSFVKRLIPIIVVILVSSAALIFSPPASAQFNGVPASVTSIGFGGHFDRAPGVPSSVTSFGFGQNAGRTGSIVFPASNGQFFNEPDCCINPLFPRNSNSPRLFRHRRHDSSFFPVGGAVYAVPYPVVVEPAADDSMEEEDYRGGPTIFDRRGSGQLARRQGLAWHGQWSTLARFPGGHRPRQSGTPIPTAAHFYLGSFLVFALRLAASL